MPAASASDSAGKVFLKQECKGGAQDSIYETAETRHCKVIIDNERLFDLGGSLSEVTSWQPVNRPASVLYLATFVFLKKKKNIEHTFNNWEISHRSLVSDFS